MRMLSTDPITEAEGVYPYAIEVDYGTARHILGQYEGWRATARAAGGGALCVPLFALPPGLLALSVWVVHGGLAAYGVGLVSLLTASLPGWAFGRRLWERPVRLALPRYTTYNPRVAQVLVSVGEEDVEGAWAALRRAGLVDVYTRTRGDISARPLNVTISVARGASVPPLDDFAARDAVCDVFRATRIHANVGGIEINSPANGSQNHPVPGG